MRLDSMTAGPWAFAALLACACNNDDPGGAGNGGTGSSSTAGSSDSGTTSDSADSSSGGQGGSSSGGDSGTTAAPPTEIDIDGSLEDFFMMGAIADADIRVLDTPGFETVSDANGLWALQGVPTDHFDRFVIADTKFYWGAVVPFQTGFEDIEEFELSQVSLDVIDLQINALQMQDKTVMVEDNTAVLLVALLQNTATGATAELDPPPADNAFYAPNAAGSPILGTSEILWGLYPVAVFFNLEPGPEGTYDISVTHPERECTVDDPQPPTFGRHINLIRVDCPPPM